MDRPRSVPRRLSSRALTVAVAVVLVAAALAACSAGAPDSRASTIPDPEYTTKATDTFPVTVEHKFGETVVPAEPRRVVVVGLTEQDILLELGVRPIATTEWYGEQPYAVWPWATELLGDVEPVVLDASDGLQLERIATLEPDLIVGTNAGLTRQDYETLSEIAPTVTSVQGSEQYFSNWRDQTRQVAAAVGRSAAGEKLVDSVETAYAEAAAAHPEFEGLTATFSQATPSDGTILVYPDGLNTDFLTELGFVMTPGLRKYTDGPGTQARIAAERTDLLEADVIVFATEEAGGVRRVLDFGSISALEAVRERRTVFTDATLAGAIYFMTPLSQKYVIEHLVPRLTAATNGQAPRTIDG